ncbi:MAG: hypothetical protein FWH52_06395 [Synergistaceae bacterium]|nr:hypothetical protein [Synergistaceae bacterium]
MKVEYDLSTMKRKGHPLRNKVSQGEIKLINPLDIPDRESKLAKLTPEERELVNELLEKYFTTRSEE